MPFSILSDIVATFTQRCAYYYTCTKVDKLDRCLFIWTPFLFISVFESTAYLKFAKLQYVSSGFRCGVITGSLMRLY